MTKVSEKILADAKTEAQRIQAEADQQAREILTQADQEAGRRQVALDDDIQKATEAHRLQLLARARVQARLAELGVRQEMMQAVFDAATKQVAEMPAEAYRDLVKKWLVEAVEVGDERVVIGTDETRIDASLIDAANRELGERGHLALADQRRGIAGGVILARERTEVNASLEVMLQQVRRELETELARVLFGE